MSNELATSYKWRHERKFLILELSLQELESIVKLHPHMFLERYRKRFVNNIYFDSMMLKNYLCNVDGNSERIKVRIRWYGNLFGFIEKPVLELKIKNGMLGRKESFPLSPFSLDQHFATQKIMAIVKKSNVPDAVKKEMHYLEPVLLNRYKRKYYSSIDKNYRITIDSDMVFYNMGRHNNSFLSRMVDNQNLVLELKYDENMYRYVEEITNRFPFRFTKNSKYVNGVEMLTLW